MIRPIDPSAPVITTTGQVLRVLEDGGELRWRRGHEWPDLFDRDGGFVFAWREAKRGAIRRCALVRTVRGVSVYQLPARRAA